MYFYFRTPSWVDGILVGLSLALLVGPLWYAILVFGDLAAMVQGNPTGVSLAPVTGILRTLTVGVLRGAVVLLPVSLYLAARELRASGRSWQPNPGTYALGGVLFPLSVLVATYYLLRRTFSSFEG